MPHPHLMVEHDPAGYRWLRLARPQRRNALDVGLTAAIRDALAAEPSVPVLLGSADPAMFCAGADLTISNAERAAVSDLIYDCCHTIITRPGPVIAVLSGAAVGGGAQLAAAADLRIASPAARLRWVGPPGVNLTVGAWVLPDLVGRGPAMDLVLTGRWLEAAEALALGLLNHLSPEPDALAAEIAADLARRGVAAGIKPVMAAGGLPDRLEAERAANRSAWAQLNAPVPQVSRPVPSPAAGEP
jgi:enoyl-CoA hydratase/carnithine racemase